MWFLRLCCLVACVAEGACMAHAPFDAYACRQVQQRHVGKVLELRHSQYYGDLYDDNERWLLSTLPFSHTYHLVDLAGQPLVPNHPRGLLPAGTSVQIMAIEFPTPWRVAKRMVTTPRRHVWVLLRPKQVLPSLSGPAPDLVLVLPDDVVDASGAETALTAALAPNGEVTAWLARLRPTVQVAIAHKEVVPGMDTAELIASLGEPAQWLVDQVPGPAQAPLPALAPPPDAASRGPGPAARRPMRVAWYPNQEVWLDDGVVQQVRPSRQLDLMPAAP